MPSRHAPPSFARPRCSTACRTPPSPPPRPPASRRPSPRTKCSSGRARKAMPLYVVVEGRLAVLAETGEGPPRPVGTVGAGECIGEGALLLAGRRTATARCRDRLPPDPPLPRGGSRARWPRSPAVRAVLTTLVARRMPALRAAEDEIFGALDEAARRRVEGELSWVYLQRDEVLFREGDPADALYVVPAGTAAGGARAAGPSRRGRDRDRPRPAGGGDRPPDRRRAVVHRPRHPRHRADPLLGAGLPLSPAAEPPGLDPLMRTLARRLQRTTVAPAAAAARSTVIAIVPPGAPLSTTSRPDSCPTSARTGARACWIRAPSTPSTAPAPRARLPTTRAHVHERVAARPGGRARRPRVRGRRGGGVVAALRPAGRPHRARRPRRGPARARRVRALVGRGRTTAGRVLVLLHRGRRRAPSGTAAWLDATEVDRHHHVRDGVAADARRVSRASSVDAQSVSSSAAAARAPSPTPASSAPCSKRASPSTSSAASAWARWWRPATPSGCRSRDGRDPAAHVRGHPAPSRLHAAPRLRVLAAQDGEGPARRLRGHGRSRTSGSTTSAWRPTSPAPPLHVSPARPGVEGDAGQRIFPRPAPARPPSRRPARGRRRARPTSRSILMQSLCPGPVLVS